MKTLDDVLLQLRAMSQTTREQGDYFERLIKRVLTISPWYADQFSNVWLWKDWPGRGRNIDSGIDIVAERADTGHLVGIQCKFYEEGHYLDKGQLNSFFAALGQEPFREGMVFSTTDNWSKQAELLLDHPTKPVNRVRVQDLRDAGIDWSTFILVDPEESMQTTVRKKARPHQTEAIDNVIDGFMVHDRGQLIMACGTGKTLTSLRLVEKLVPQGVTSSSSFHRYRCCSRRSLNGNVRQNAPFGPTRSARMSVSAASRTTPTKSGIRPGDPRHN